MDMKKYYLILLTIILGCFTLSAQERKCKDEMFNEIKEYKMKFLAQEMELTSRQQPKFFELYDKMMKEKHNVYKEARALGKKVKNNANATEADYEALSTARNKAKAKDQEIEKRYEAQFATFLSAKQIYKWKEAEEKFRKRMHEMRSSKKGKKK